MPATVQAALILLGLQAAFSLVGAVFMVVGVIADFSGPRLLLLLCGMAIIGLMGWLMSRWRSRRKPVRWGAIAVEVAVSCGYLVLAMVDGELHWATLLGPGGLLPFSVVVLLLLPPAGRWFDR